METGADIRTLPTGWVRTGPADGYRTSRKTAVDLLIVELRNRSASATDATLMCLDVVYQRYDLLNFSPAIATTATCPPAHLGRPGLE